ncbi:tyrosine-type recombinase/integrase [Sphingomonas sp. PB4P5]|uniref:tyrosine-type recombinase/integrase n=1 Tax=Parasphingomonas puruogangriensis TaxID=3096155 RepID=UPI002FC5DC25
MATIRIRITKRLVESLERDGKVQLIRDTDVRGFAVQMSPAGLITYTLRYRFDGRQGRWKIGVHGEPWTPDTARTEARILLGKIAKGIDPRQEKIDHRNGLTVAELGDLYLTKGLYAAKDSSVSQARRNIENHINPLIGARRVSSIKRSDITQLLCDVADGRTRRTRKTGHRGLSRVTGGRGAASQTVTTLSAMLGFAVDEGLRDDNPGIGIKRFQGKKMERFLSPPELARLGEALAAATSLGVESIFAIAALRLLILTGCRRNEILTLKHSNIDVYHRCLRLPDSKTGAKTVHLGAPALRVIAQLPQVEGNPYLLPGKKDGTHVTNLQKVWARIREAAALENVRIHDLRHSFASVGASAGDSMPIIGKLLGHRSAKTTERYMHIADTSVTSAAERISDEIAKHLGEAVPLPTAHDFNELDPFGTFWTLQQEGEARPSNPQLGMVARTKWLDTRAAAAMLGYSPDTLQNYRTIGIGPAFRKVGRRVVYAAEALQAWQAVQFAGRSATHAS